MLLFSLPCHLFNRIQAGEKEALKWALGTFARGERNAGYTQNLYIPATSNANVATMYRGIILPTKKGTRGFDQHCRTSVHMCSCWDTYWRGDKHKVRPAEQWFGVAKANATWKESFHYYPSNWHRRGRKSFYEVKESPLVWEPGTCRPLGTRLAL
jgi:hypothetical protein